MSKKLLTACLALVALAAFALPATASASPELTYPTGTTLAAGSLIEGTNIGETLMTTSGGSVLTNCATATMTGELTKNNGTEAEGTITSASFSGTATEGRCTGTFGAIRVTTAVTNGLPWCLRATKAMEPDEFQVRGGKCSEALRKIVFILDSSTAGECKYERTTAIPGTFATHPSDATMTISKVKFTRFEGGFLCPAEGYLDMTFTLEKDTTDGVADPIYIS